MTPQSTSPLRRSTTSPTTSRRSESAPPLPITVGTECARLRVRLEVAMPSTHR
jgi:hypothetical protein